MGRTEEKKNGTLQSIGGYSSIAYDLEIGILDGKEEIDQFERRCIQTP
jgi:hypothetical protein